MKNLFLHFVFRTRRKKFWQPICWSLADSQKKFRPKFGSQTRNFFGKFFFPPSVLPEPVESSFWQLYVKFFLPKFGKIFARSSSMYQKHWKIQNNRFPQLVFWTSRNWFWQLFCLNSAELQKKFEPKTDGKNFSKRISPKCLSELLECGLGKFAKKLPKFRNTFPHSSCIHIDQKFLRKVSFVKMISKHAGYVFDYFSV